jgi:multicomponent K+:H+ antiporter subunit A
MLVLGHIVGSYDLDMCLLPASRCAHPLYLTALVLLLLGAFTKSAQFPFHFWLPHAMAAPTPVSAYLHSATMVKAGVFLLAGCGPCSVAPSPGSGWWAVRPGTLLVGGYAAMFQNDLKGLLAYSTISHLGLITLLLGLNSPLAAVAAVFHIMNHATFKASLFMAGASCDHESGTRDIRRLSGLRSMMPITATLAMVASAAMAGCRCSTAFVQGDVLCRDRVPGDATRLVAFMLPMAATLAGMFSVAYSLRFTVDVFFGPPPPICPSRRTSRRTGCACRWSCWCWCAWWWACCPPGRWAPSWHAAARPVVGGELALQPGRLAWGQHPLVMSLVAWQAESLYGVAALRSAPARWMRHP